MTADSLWRLQKAVYDALCADATLTGLVPAQSVYDYVPKTATYPYVAFGDLRLRPFDTHGSQGFEADFDLHVFSRYQGNKEAQQIAAALQNILHRGNLMIAGHAVVLIASNGLDVTLQGDGETRHARLGFKIIFEPNA